MHGKTLSSPFNPWTTRVLRLSATLILAPALVHPSQSAELVSGPMVGHTTTSTAKIWVETDAPSTVQVDYFVSPGNRIPLVIGSAQARTTGDFPHVAVVELKDLTANAQVRYSVRVNNRIIRPLGPQVFQTMPREPDGGNGADFMVAFGSCMNPVEVPYQTIWNKALQFRPAAFLFIGDINYMPGDGAGYGDDREIVRLAMAGYHREARDVPGVRTLMATTPSYGIWDDHDYGPNNSDRTFKWRDESIGIYNRYWPNVKTHDNGVYHSFRIADAEFFMLDNRANRDPNEAQDRAAMFGPEQMAWLRNGLKASTATFKILANGNTMAAGNGENWSHFGSERDDFLKWMFGENITGVVFIAGDWHVGTLNRLHRPQDDYPIYELLSSNLGVRKLPIDTGPTATAGGNHHSAANTYPGYNFGALSFSGKKDARTITLQIIDEEGNVRIHRRLGENDLKPRPR
jgi:alkaline phosphatase D